MRIGILRTPTTPINIQQCAQITHELPPQPNLSIQEEDMGIFLCWTHNIGQNHHAELSSYQIFACKQPLNPKGNIRYSVWKHVGSVKALPLPMGCILSQLTEENRYHFIIRGVDVYNRTGPFCEMVSIVPRKKH